MTKPAKDAYIIAARRTAIGRVGGLHRARRVEDLAVAALSAALKDCSLESRDVQHLIVGNASQGGNPARLIGLCAGLPDSAPALTIDQHCASGLEAILAAIRLVRGGECDVVAAGGAESLSNAPWRLAKPRMAQQTPAFIDICLGSMNATVVDAEESLAARSQISRSKQDDYALAARKAGRSAQAKSMLSIEIAPVGTTAQKNRDEWLEQADSREDLGELPTFAEAAGTLTAGNTSQPGDGAAIAIIVNQAVYERLGRPKALQLAGSASVGTAPNASAAAPIEAVRKLQNTLNGAVHWPSVVHELNETSAAQAIAYRDALAVAADRFNQNGGALAHGRPLGASSSALIVRLLAQVRSAEVVNSPLFYLAASGSQDGIGTAAVFASKG